MTRPLQLQAVPESRAP